MIGDLTAQNLQANLELTRANAQQVASLTANLQAQLPGLKAQSTTAQVSANFAQRQNQASLIATKLGNALKTSELPEAQALGAYWTDMGEKGVTAEKIAQGIQGVLNIYRAAKGGKGLTINTGRSTAQ